MPQATVSMEHNHSPFGIAGAIVSFFSGIMGGIFSFITPQLALAIGSFSISVLVGIFTIRYYHVATKAKKEEMNRK